MNKQSKSQELVHIRLKPVEISLLAAICLRENLNRSEAVRQSIRTQAKISGVYNVAESGIKQEAGDEH